jgi:hypothetical protein
MENSDFSRLKSVVEATLQHHMNVGHDVVPDDRDFIRPWARRLRDLTAEHTLKLTEFLEKPALDSFDSHTSHTKFVSTLITGLASDGWMKRNVAPVVTDSAILEAVESDIGCSISQLRTSNHNAMNLYLETVKTLFAQDEKLASVLNELETAKTRVEHVIEFEDSGPAADTLQAALLTYLESKYKSCSLEADYKKFCETYTRFNVLRNIVLGLKKCEEVKGESTCGICTVEKVTAALVPCGHVFCNNCCQKQRSECYVCRSSIKDRLRIYFL